MLVDNYIGNDLTTDVYDELAYLKIDEKFLTKEAALYSSKWFDYRHLHPTLATYLYAHHYTSEYRKVYQRIRDAEKGKYVTGSKGKDEMQKKSTLGFWKGRQSADELGMPYNLYIGSVMRFLVEDTIWKRIPTPSQLYSSKVRLFMIDEWAKLLETSIVEPDTAILSDDTEFSREHKRSIEKYLCEQIIKRTNPLYGLSHFMFDRHLITETLALQYFSSDAIEQARRFAL